MANTTSGSYSFDKNLGIDEIIEDAYERIGMQSVSGYQLKTAKRSLNILFSEWGNRGLQFWEVKNQNVTLVDGQAVYTFFRSPADGTSSGVSTTLSAGINTSSYHYWCCFCYGTSYSRWYNYYWDGTNYLFWNFFIKFNWMC